MLHFGQMTNNQEAIGLINQLELAAHPEGGFYKEVYRSAQRIPDTALPKEFNGSRNYATSIYFLLTAENFSAFHKINQDETWHFYKGSPLRIHMITPKGNYSFVDIGMDLDNNIEPQFTVPAQVWFAAQVLDQNGFSLLGCQVAPGFDFKDFTLAKKQELISLFPKHGELICQFTRN